MPWLGAVIVLTVVGLNDEDSAWTIKFQLTGAQEQKGNDREANSRMHNIIDKNLLAFEINCIICR